MRRRYIFRIRSSDRLERWVEVCDGPEPLLQALTRLRSKASDFAASGRHGSYPYGDAPSGSFNEAVEEGFSEDGASWEAKDGTVISFAPAEDVPAALVLTVPGAGFRPDDGTAEVIAKAERGGSVTFELRRDEEFRILRSGGDTALIEEPPVQKHVIAKLAETAVSRIDGTGRARKS